MDASRASPWQFPCAELDGICHLEGLKRMTGGIKVPDHLSDLGAALQEHLPPRHQA